MNRERAQHNREIGTRLAHYLRQRQGDWPATASLQGIVADLVGSQVDLALPLKDLVSRPAFRGLFNKAAGGSGALDRDALLQDLQRTFAAEIVNDLAEVLNGILDLPLGSGHVGVPTAGLKPGMSPDVTSASALGASVAVSVPTPTPAPASIASPPASKGPLLAVSLVTAALAAGAVVAVRTPPFCAAFNLCSAAGPTSPSDAALQAATAAEQALGRATSLDAYASALEQLERELLKLSGDPLSSTQQLQRETLQAAARDARRNLEAEQADQQQLALAQEAYALASSSSGSVQDGQINAARQALAAIPPRSFAAAEASRLRSALEQLTRQPDPVPVEAPPSVDGGSESASDGAGVSADPSLR